MCEPGIVTPWGPRWIAAGLRARRALLVAERRSLAARSIPSDVRRLGVDALTAIIAEVDVQIARLELHAGAEPAHDHTPTPETQGERAERGAR